EQEKAAAAHDDGARHGARVVRDSHRPAAAQLRAADQEPPTVVVDPGDLDRPARCGAADDALPDIDVEHLRQADGVAVAANADAGVAADHRGLDRALHRLGAIVGRRGNGNDGEYKDQQRARPDPDKSHRASTITQIDRRRTLTRREARANSAASWWRAGSRSV